MTIQKTALVRAVAAAAVLCLSGTAAQAIEYNFSQSFVGTGGLNNITGTLSGRFEAGTVSVSGLFENLVYTNVSFTGSYVDLITSAVVPVSFTSSGPFNVPTTPGFNAYTPFSPTLSEADTGLAVAASSGGLSLTWSAGELNLWRAGDPITNPLPISTGTPFGQLTFFSGASPVAQGNSYTYVNTSPVPEVSTYLMMMVGIAAVGAAVRRRAV